MNLCESLTHDKLSCQQFGARGPPFAPAAQPSFGRALASWLPWSWYSIDGSFNELRQIAHVSAQMSQLHLRA